MRIAFTDGEMSNLSADYGQLLCACVLEYGTNKLHTFRLRNYAKKRWDDRSLAKEWRDALEDYDILVTWNGVKFDIPFLNTRLRRWDERELRAPKHKDLMYTARYKLRLSNSRLDTVARFLNCTVTKSFLDPENWTMAIGGYAPAYRYIIDHCQRDVRVLGEVWNKTKHLVTEIK